ncbi:MAG TPA: tRNA (N(6)-L-threonylcarbamoyladenosine(37)-C(2))-methylthiotransferase MtaB [Bacillota bacterium]|nr:tRNA (N(6)-L-threonylcarbamoyladenosine(37)-C(2))-methylthiotransferase MtaB [Bacillota bacterium]HOB86319.1 tRNA (N(6)-L-threonylcarbamoyladenosine(37)-C(2))-methylthiotransferase MtaB [Bacillota bacterium]HOP69516.1 tRNA (N(6)-L-threonylcarbamoyladenosine(37)-C(2))-methylthiotransferase MtaB [Bacillota bacterium]HPT34465.1 tRNA (N(6)-L-threonylcarbamoyladenosine(37)-C(2))-methylthiotransferase MtaB [Bacillota bacterium]HPZ64620.1 tRNA (N(6)-L-threonylcarbamoyladenosine(37)-C(2))-methylthio
MKKRVAFYTLGCKVNYCETESLEALFRQAGYTVADFEDVADVYVINTCTVTHLSDHKSRKMIRRARRRNPRGIVVATGCYAQGFPEELAKIAGVDLIVGTQGREKLPQLVESLREGAPLNLVRPYGERPAFEVMPYGGKHRRTRGFLKIQEGCNRRCSYCIIPLVRGPQRSLPPQAVLERAREMIAAGCRELVLTGIHLGMYGSDLEGVTLASLLRQLEKLEGLLRLRLSSLEPMDITGELVEQIALSSKICPHLHIPLQSGDDAVLERMNRGYRAAEYAYLIQWLRQELPGLAISTDVIVGFPGETEEQHRNTMDLVRRLKFSRLHVFKFSPRPGTAAAEMEGEPPPSVKERRSREMIALGEELASAYRKRAVGSIQEVLVEKVVPYRHGEGFTPDYIRARVALKGQGRRWRGREIKMLVQGEEKNFIFGTPLR